MSTPAPSQVLAVILDTKGVGTENEALSNANKWAIKYGHRTEVPENIIVLTDTGGSNPNTKYQLDFVHVQALIRAGKFEYLAGRAKAQEIKDALLGLDSQDVTVGAFDPVRVDGITMNGDVAFLRYDENDRPLFSANFRILMEREVNLLSNRDSL